MTLQEPIARTRERLNEMRLERQAGVIGAYTLSVAEQVPGLLDHIEELTAHIAAMRPVVEYVSLGRKFVNAAYPDGIARRVLGRLDDAFLASPEARALLPTEEPTGPGKPDDPAEIQWRMDEALPGALVELRAAVAERDNRIARLEVDLADAQDAASSRFVEDMVNETRLRSIDFRNGMHMDLEPAREIAAALVAAARTMLGDAPNYTETKVEMDVKVAESPEMFTFVVQRHKPGCLTPHEARVAAEAKVARLEGEVAEWAKVAADRAEQVRTVTRRLLAARDPKPVDDLAPQVVALATETGPNGLVLNERTGTVTELPAFSYHPVYGRTPSSDGTAA